jgi:hypothetical protein
MKTGGGATTKKECRIKAEDKRFISMIAPHFSQTLPPLDFAQSQEWAYKAASACSAAPRQLLFPMYRHQCTGMSHIPYETAMIVALHSPHFHQ